MRLLLQRTLESIAATQALAQDLLPLLPPGAVVALQGPLGAGKTTLVQALVQALGFSGRATSPTYTLVHLYPTPAGPVVHADLYRLEDPTPLLPELEALEEGARLTLVEWGDPGRLGASHLLRLIPQGKARRVELWEVHPREQQGV